MPAVLAKTHESFEALLRRFKREVEKAGVLSELRKHMYFEPKSAEKKRLLAAAKKRSRKKSSRDFGSYTQDRTH